MNIIDNDLKFITTMVFKSHLIALANENNFKLINKYHAIPDNIREWGYYLNLTGLPHKYNKEILFNNPINNEVIKLSKEFLTNNTFIRDYIKDNWIVLQNLLTKYPGDNTYILGMLSPLDMDILLNSEEGTILYYNKEYIHYYEKNLILELEKFIKNFLFNYGNPGYVVSDSLYTVGLSFVLIQSLVNKLKELRYYNQDSYQVSDDLMSKRFNSNLLIGEQVKVFPRTIRLWLYKNLNYIKHNIGKDKTIDILIDNIIKPLNLGIAEVILKPTNTKLLNNNIKRSNQEKIFNTLNLKDRITNKVTPVSYKTVYQMEMKNSESYFTNDEDIFLNYDNRLKLDRGIYERSKHFIISNKNIGLNRVLDMEKYILEAVMILLTNNLNKNFHIEINGIERELKSENILILFLFYLQDIAGLDSIVKNIKIRHIFNKQSPEYMVNGLFNETSIKDKYISIVEDINQYISIKRTDVINEVICHSLIEETFNLWMRLKGHMFLLNSGTLSANMSMLYKRLMIDETIVLPRVFQANKITDLVKLRNLRLNKNSIIGINEIIKSLSGFNIIQEENKLLNNVKVLMDKLTSYTVDFITNDSTVDIEVTTPLIENLTGVNIFSLKNVEYDCLGAVGNLSATADDGKLDYAIIDEKTTNISISDIDTIPSFITAEIFNDIKTTPISNYSITVSDV